MNMTRHVATAAVVAVIVCARSLAAQGPPQPPPPPAQSPSQTGSGAAPAAAPPMTFRQVLDLATAQNLELAAVRRSRAIREAEVRAARQWSNPEFSAEITRDTPHGDLAIGFPVDIGGTRSRRVALARAGLAMADVDEASALKQLRRDVRLAFYGLLIANETAALADDVVRVARRVRDVAQARFEAGAAPRLDVMQADLGVVRAQAESDMARSSRLAAQADLNALLNRPPGMTIALAGEAADLPPLPTPDGAMASALAHNLDLLALDKEAESEAANLRLLKAQRIPEPTFTVGTALNAPGEFNVGAHAGIGLAIPLFSRNQGEIAGSLARTDTLRARRDALRRRIEARIFAATERVAAARARVEAFRTALLPTATELQGLAEESYRLGRDSMLSALDAQRSLRDVKFEYLQALAALQEAVAELEDILGAPIQ